jgi:hypothetical protein
MFVIYFSTKFNIIAPVLDLLVLLQSNYMINIVYSHLSFCCFMSYKKKSNRKSYILLKGLLPHIISGASISPISCICTNAVLLLWRAVQRLKWLVVLKFCKNCSLGSKVDAGTYRQCEHPVRPLPFFLRKQDRLKIYRLWLVVVSPIAVYFSYKFSCVCKERQTWHVSM